MSLLTKIIFIILLVIAIAYFAPKTYDNSKDWVVDKVSQSTTQSIGGGVNSVLNFNEFDCDNDKECWDHYDIQGLKCVNKKCLAGE